MSTIKKFVEFVLGIFLCLFLFLSLFSLTGYQLTSVETVKDILKSVILQSPEVSNSTIEVYTSMRQVCELDPNMEFDNINAGITTITIKCSEILPLNYDGFVSHIIDKIVNSIYYTEPKCEILECLREGGTTALLAFLTEKTHKTIFSFFSYMVLISFLIILVLIYLTEKYWKLRTIGICFGVVGFLGFIVVASINSYLEKSPFIGRAEISQIV
ncbi:MAG: hypothetical protein QXP04_02085, partial [Candidatus Nanoarchaeia archaeon]|nr:hypothetical protein [Candidatus Jingweiarchaeum tengchongense]